MRGLLGRMGSSALDGGALGTVGGAAMGGVGGGIAEMNGAQPGTAGAAALMGGAGGGLGGMAGGGLARMVMEIAQMLKRQRPDLPDEVILQEAQKIAQQQGGGMERSMGYDTAQQTGGRMP